MKKTQLYVIAVLVVLVAAGAYLGTRSPANDGGNFNSTGQNTFTGSMVGGNLAPGVYNNVAILSDRGCTTDPRTGLSNCTTSFTIKPGGTAYYFNYEHNMMMKPCLSIGDKVDVEVLNGGGAVVNRTYWAGGGA